MGEPVKHSNAKRQTRKQKQGRGIHMILGNKYRVAGISETPEKVEPEKWVTWYKKHDPMYGVKGKERHRRLCQRMLKVHGPNYRFIHG